MTREDMESEIIGYDRTYNKIDAECAREYKCEECGADCHYEGYRKNDSYRAFSVCTNGHVFEF
jgi:hypothetical protein